MTVERPGFKPGRMIRLMKDAIDRCHLDLSGKVVLTEAATGAYAVTPVLAAMAGASNVVAVAKPSRYGSRAEAIRQTGRLASLAKVQSQIHFPVRAGRSCFAEADIITNSGHLRPLDAEKIGYMKSTAVIALMYEAWEYRPADLDLSACRERGIQVVATNEQHPNIDVFGYLGVLAMKQLMDAGVAVYKSRILLLSDNAFSPYIEKVLRRAGAVLDLGRNLKLVQPTAAYDAILLAMSPGGASCLAAPQIRRLAKNFPETVLVQFFGDPDRAACLKSGLATWPLESPSPGHMGILPSDIGPEAIIRLQAGGLKAAEVAGKPGCLSMKSYAVFM